ncbi:MAG: sugar transferase, partial [Caldilineales bacterium]|nr:sugar transferase [Caldilineales bacterium]
LTAHFFDCYSLVRAASTFNSVRNTSIAVIVTALLYLFLPWFTPPLGQRTPIYIFVLLMLAGIALWRVAYSLLLAQPWFFQKALVVGAGLAGQTLAQAVVKAGPHDANPYRGTGYNLVGFIDDNPEYRNRTIAGLPVLGGRENLVDLVQRLQVDEIIVAITYRHGIAAELLDALVHCRELGYRIITMSTLYQRLLNRVPVLHVGYDLHMITPMDETASARLYLMLRQLLDYITAISILLLLALITPIIWLVNRYTSPGPLFYRQARVGKGGKLFQCIKFRSMVPDAEYATGAIWAEEDDPRITPMGRWLRRTRLDELPQVLNILKGEMSLIGPRPERPEFVEQLAQTIPFYRTRHAVKPGITGWAQVLYRYGNSNDDARVKLEFDLYYVLNRSLWLDINIIFKTVATVFQMKGR